VNFNNGDFYKTVTKFKIWLKSGNLHQDLQYDLHVIASGAIKSS